MHSEIAALKALAVKFAVGTCDAAAISTAVGTAFSLIQGLFGAIGAVLSALYLFYRVKKIRAEK